MKTPEYLEGGNEFAHGLIDSDGNFVFVTQYAGCTEEVGLASLEDQNRAIALFLAAPEMLEALRAILEWADPFALPDCDRNERDVENARAILQRLENLK